MIISIATLAFCGALLMYAESGLMGAVLGAFAALEFFGFVVIPVAVIVGFIGKYAVRALARRSASERFRG
jgi:hypothetical protein